MDNPYEDVGLRHRQRMAAEYLEGAKPIRQRLIGAYTQHLLPLRVEDFPEHRRADFAALQGLFRERGPLGLLDMPEEEAEESARLILALYADLDR